MTQDRSKRAGWRFSFSVLIPVIIAVVVTVGTAAAFVVWSAAKSDDRALARQTKLVSHMLGKEHEYIASEQNDITSWDDAFFAFDSRPDMEWIDENLGAGFFESHGYNRIYVLDPHLRPVYAMREGGKVAPQTFEADRAAVAALAEKHLSVDGQSAIEAYLNGFAEVPYVTDMAVIDGRPALIGVVPILPEAKDVRIPPRRTFFHVAIRFLDNALAGELMDQYLIEGAHFTSDAEAAAGEASFPLLNQAGETVAYFRWVPDRPGAQILNETMPAMLGALLAGGGIIALLMRGLRRSSAELEAARAEAHHRALHDPLTGLANRAGFQERLTQAIAALRRNRSPVALLALDLDRFKQVNDRLGHEAGDRLLQQVALRLQPLLRDTDTLARLGGDEFAIIQTAIKTVGDCKTLSERIISRIREPFMLEGVDASIGVSIGIAVAGDADNDGEDLTSRADYALYEAKDAGRDRYHVFGERNDGERMIPVPSPANANRVA